MTNQTSDAFRPVEIVDLLADKPCFVIVYVGAAAMRFGPMTLDAALSAAESCEQAAIPMLLTCEPGPVFDFDIARDFVATARALLPKEEDQT